MNESSLSLPYSEESSVEKRKKRPFLPLSSLHHPFLLSLQLASELGQAKKWRRWKSHFPFSFPSLFSFPLFPLNFQVKD